MFEDRTFCVRMCVLGEIGTAKFFSSLKVFFSCFKGFCSSSIFGFVSDQQFYVQIESNVRRYYCRGKTTA